MKLVSMNGSVAGQDPATETIFLSQRHASFLAKMSGEINPEMPKASGWPHAIRTNVDGKTIEIRDVPIQQDDCDLRPGLGVNNGSPAIAFYRLHTFSSQRFYGQTADSVMPSGHPRPSVFKD